MANSLLQNLSSASLCKRIKKWGNNSENRSIKFRIINFTLIVIVLVMVACTTYVFCCFRYVFWVIQCKHRKAKKMRKLMVSYFQKYLLVSWILPKNERKNATITLIPQVNLFLFVFWKKLKTPKSTFEISSPLRVHLLDTRGHVKRFLRLYKGQRWENPGQVLW